MPGRDRAAPRHATAGPAAARNLGLAAVTTPARGLRRRRLPRRAAAGSSRCCPTSPTTGWPPSPPASPARPRPAPACWPATSRRAPRSTSAPPRAGCGPAPAISYVPAAALVARADVLLATGGFDEDLRCRRGRRPRVAARRERPPGALRARRRRRTTSPAPTLRAWLGPAGVVRPLGRRLAQRHPGAPPPLAVSGWSAAVWALGRRRRPGGRRSAIAGGHRPGPQPASCGTSTTRWARRCGSPAPATCSPGGCWPAPSPGRGGRSSLALALVVAAGPAGAGRRRRRPAALVDWVRQRPPLDPVALRRRCGSLDDVAYGAGAVAGRHRPPHRRAAPARPHVVAAAVALRRRRHRTSMTLTLHVDAAPGGRGPGPRPTPTAT